MTRAHVIGTGSYAPKRVLTNHDLESMVDTSDKWILSRTGIKERHVCANESTSEMAVKAARRALKAARVPARSIDLVIVGTVTSDMIFPSTACFVQSKIGMKAGTTAFDVSAACSGFMYALDVADKYIRSGAVSRALVIGVDSFSRILDWNDRSTCVLFGDGAGAVVLSADKSKSKRGILSCHSHSDGAHWDMLYTPGAVPASPFEKKRPKRQSPVLRMKGNETFKVAVRTMGRAVAEVLEHNGLAATDIDLLIPHQANMRIIKAMKTRLKLPEEKVFTNLDRYGNTSAGSIPLALDEAVRTGRIKENDLVVFVSFGGGFTWASAAVKW